MIRQVFTLSSIAFVVIALGCSRQGPSGEEPAPTRRFVSVGTAPPGGAFFVVGSALSEVLAEALGDQGWQVTAEATKGTQENIRRLASGELDFALANAAINYFAVRGESGWEQAYPMRSVMTLVPNIALFVTIEGSGIESIAALKGRRVVLGPAGAGFDYFLKPILAAHDVTYAELTELHNTQSGAVTMLADGSADAAFLGGAVPTASITQAATSQDIAFVPFDAEAVAELVEKFPFFHHATIPAGTYRNVDVEFSGLNVGSMQFITSAAQSDDTVYRVTKTIYENRQKVVEKHPAGRAIQAKNIVRDIGTEFHPGAIRYYREIGIWPESPSAVEAAETAAAPEPAAAPGDIDDASSAAE